MRDKARKCQHRDARIVRAYYDANGHHRVKHAFDYCHADAVAVDVYGYGYCVAHRNDGDYDAIAYVNLDELLEQLRARNREDEA